jgi:hypothetical protein
MTNPRTSSSTLPQKAQAPSAVCDPHQLQLLRVPDQESLTTLRRSNTCTNPRSQSKERAGERFFTRCPLSPRRDQSLSRALSLLPSRSYFRSSLQISTSSLSHLHLDPVSLVPFSYRHGSGPSCRAGAGKCNEFFVDIGKCRCRGFLLFFSSVAAGDGGVRMGAGARGW